MHYLESFVPLLDLCLVVFCVLGEIVDVVLTQAVALGLPGLPGFRSPSKSSGSSNGRHPCFDGQRLKFRKQLLIKNHCSFLPD